MPTKRCVCSATWTPRARKVAQRRGSKLPSNETLEQQVSVAFCTPARHAAQQALPALRPAGPAARSPSAAAAAPHTAARTRQTPPCCRRPAHVASSANRSHAACVSLALQATPCFFNKTYSTQWQMLCATCDARNCAQTQACCTTWDSPAPWSLFQKPCQHLRSGACGRAPGLRGAP